MEGLYQSQAAPALRDVNAFQGVGHENRTRPYDCPDGPLAMETSLRVEAWRTKYPKTGWQRAPEFEVQCAAVKGVCVNICKLTGHRWDTNSEWRDFVHDADLLSLYSKRSSLTATLETLSLDAEALPVKTDPRYTCRQKPQVAEADRRSLHEKMLAHGRREQPNLPAVPAQQSSFNSMPPRRLPVTRPVSKQPKLGETKGYDTTLPAPWKKHRDILPASWTAAQRAAESFEHAKSESIEAWRCWYVKDELPIGYWDQHLTRVSNPDEGAIASVSNLPGDFPWGVEHLIMDSWADGKLNVIPENAIMKGNTCLGIARDQPNIFAWMIEGKAEGIPYRHCHREQDHVNFPAWLSSQASPANSQLP